MNVRQNEIRGAHYDKGGQNHLKELHEKDAKKDEAKKKKREKIMKRNERMKKYARRGQIVRNIAGATTAISVGLAAGADPEDFVVGSAVGKAVAGKVSKKDSGDNKKSTNKSSKNKDSKGQENKQTQNNQQQAGGIPNQTQAAANANAATQAADLNNPPMTKKEAAKAQETSALQQSFRQQIASKQVATQGKIGDTGVNSHTSITHTEE